MIGTQQVDYWSGRETPTRHQRTERFIHIPMPWTKAMYTVSNDDFGLRRPVFGIYWYRPAPWAFAIRFGWLSRAVPGQLGECQGGAYKSADYK